MNEQQERWRRGFQAVTQSPEIAERLIALVKAYHERSTWTFDEVARMVQGDLLRGRPVEAVVKTLEDQTKIGTDEDPVITARVLRVITTGHD